MVAMKVLDNAEHLRNKPLVLSALKRLSELVLCMERFPFLPVLLCNRVIAMEFV